MISAAHVAKRRATYRRHELKRFAWSRITVERASQFVRCFLSKNKSVEAHTAVMRVHACVSYNAVPASSRVVKLSDQVSNHRFSY